MPHKRKAREGIDFPACPQVGLLAPPALGRGPRGRPRFGGHPFPRGRGFYGNPFAPRNLNPQRLLRERFLPHFRHNQGWNQFGQHGFRHLGRSPIGFRPQRLFPLTPQRRILVIPRRNNFGDLRPMTFRSPWSMRQPLYPLGPRVRPLPPCTRLNPVSRNMWYQPQGLNNFRRPSFDEYNDDEDDDESWGDEEFSELGDDEAYYSDEESDGGFDDDYYEDFRSGCGRGRKMYSQYGHTWW